MNDQSHPVHEVKASLFRVLGHPARVRILELLREGDDDPVLILDDVFAELDQGRRQQLAELVGDAEQVLVTGAVADDVPEALKGQRFKVVGGTVVRD